MGVQYIQVCLQRRITLHNIIGRKFQTFNQQLRKYHLEGANEKYEDSV